jgi:hypothetical protein
MWGLVCWLVDHDWCWTLTRGDDGSPGQYRCLRCKAVEDRGLADSGGLMPCRCLGGCQCQYPVFVFETEQA